MTWQKLTPSKSHLLLMVLICITGQPFSATNKEISEEDDLYVCVPSKEVYCIMIIADAKDSKHLYEDVFREYYEWREKLRLQGSSISIRAQVDAFLCNT